MTIFQRYLQRAPGTKPGPVEIAAVGILIGLGVSLTGASSASAAPAPPPSETVLTAAAAAPVSLSLFPVSPVPVTTTRDAYFYGSTFGDARLRPNGVVAKHEGNDLIAAEGQPAVASWDGTIKLSWSSLGGNTIRLTRADGSYLLYIHMKSFAVVAGQQVKTGDVVGYIGKTGAANGVSHLHFEIHPGGGPAVDPYPILSAVDPKKNRQVPVSGAATHVVVANDNLWSISNTYGISLADLLKWNGKTPTSMLQPGMVLYVSDPNASTVTTTTTPTTSPPATVPPPATTAPTTAPAPSTTTAPSPPTSPRTYVVVKNDSWWAISRKFGVTMTQLTRINGKTVKSTLTAGKTILIDDPATFVAVTTTAAPPAATTSPAAPATYTIVSGDNLWTIAHSHGMGLNRLLDLNGLVATSLIHPGLVLKLA